MAATELRESPLVYQLRAQLRKPKVGSAQTFKSEKISLSVVASFHSAKNGNGNSQLSSPHPSRVRQLPNWGLYRLPKTPEGSASE